MCWSIPGAPCSRPRYIPCRAVIIVRSTRSSASPPDGQQAWRTSRVTQQVPGETRGGTAAALIGSHARWIELRTTEHWPGWLLIPLTAVAMDGANWLAHYAD